MYMVFSLHILHKRKLIAIVALVHGNNRKYVCTQCPQTFDRKFKWDLHIKAHYRGSDSTVKCSFPNCGLYFGTTKGANNHHYQIHIRRKFDEVRILAIPAGSAGISDLPHQSDETKQSDINEKQSFSMLHWNDIDPDSHLQFLELTR